LVIIISQFLLILYCFKYLSKKIRN